MSGEAKPPEHERIVDAVLAAVTLVVAGLLMVSEVQSVTAPAEIGMASVRAIEDEGLTLDADKSLAAGVQSSIGLAGKNDATPPVVLAKLKDDIKRAYPESKVARLVWVAMAVAFRLDAEAQSELAELVHDPRAEAHHQTIDDLANLAAGRSVDALPRLEQTFAQFGASRWLITRLRERQALNRGDEPARVEALTQAVDLASTAMDRRAAVAAGEIGLVALGLLMLALFPWFVRPRLVARGYVGLDGTSPFRLDRTRRVMLAWFLAYVSFAALLPSLVALVLPLDLTSETGLQALALVIALQGLAHGAAGVTFIRLWGRRVDDVAPLGPQLGLTTLPLPRRVLGLLAWALPATSLVFVLTIAALIMSAVLFGPQQETQVALQVVISDARPQTFVLIAIGAVLIAPVMEEILFRGFLFRNLRDTIGRVPALVVSGLVFAIVHREPALLIPLTAMGMALGLLYEWSGSLLVPIMAHALWNLAQLVEAQIQYQV